jgi:hypothetical protein
MDETSAQRVAAAVWPWRDRRDETVARVPPINRTRAAGEGLAIAVVAILVAFVLKRPVAGAVVGCVAAIVLIGGLCVPSLYRGFKRAGAALARGVGFALTWMLLVPFYYICFTTGHVVLWALRKDPLERRFRAPNPSYWVAHRGPRDPASYRRQY